VSRRFGHPQPFVPDGPPLIECAQLGRARGGEDLDGDWERRADDDDWAITDPAARAAAIRAKVLAAQRERHPLSIRDLVESSGLQPRAVFI
jgi:hypothetical protein